MIIANKYEVPDKCPVDCSLKRDIKEFGQNSLCIRCPVFNCAQPKTEEDKMYLPLIEPEHYREDWALEWKMFFENDIQFPILYLDYKGE